MKTSIGKIRGLQQLADERGIFTMVAMDQRGSLTRMLDPEHPDRVAWERMKEVKLDLAATFSRHASAILIDPDYGVAAGIASGAIAGHCGLLVAVEWSGYEKLGEGRVAKLLEGWSVAKVRRLGATAVKLLVHYHPDHAQAAERQRQIVARVVEACDRHDIPAVVEAVSYGLGSPAERPEIVVRTARDLVALGIDVFKAEFPQDLKADPDEARAADWCRRLDEACGQTPWVILSAGAPMEIFRRQVEIACRSGASGFLAGRALWQDGVRKPTAEERRAYLSGQGVANFEAVAELARAHATPWTKKVGPIPAPGPDWFRAYPE
jgi:tagatose 1,6-diphosphate aldolase